MHQRYPKGILAALPALLAVLAFGGCASPTGETARLPRLTDLTGAVADLFRSKPRSETTPTAEALYKDALDYFERGRYARAISFFQQLRDEYPFSEEAADAELKIAEAYYRNEEHVLAEETYKNYLTFQPTGQHAAFVKFQLGRVNLEQFTGIDRDLEKVHEARRHFESVIRDHPDSEHVADARKHLAEARVHLAARELYIGNYYMRDERYRAARERFERVLTDYPDTPAAAAAKAQLANLPELPEAKRADTASDGTTSNRTGSDATASDGIRRDGTASEPSPDTAAAAEPAEPVRFVTKKGYDYEATAQRRWYSYLNPFSWGRGERETGDLGGRQPSAGSGQRPSGEAGAQPSEGAGQQASAGEEPPPAENVPPLEKEEQGFLGFLNLFPSSGDKAEPRRKATEAEAATAAAVVKGIDETLGTEGKAQDGAPKPPVASLAPGETEDEAGPQPGDLAEILGAVDRQLGESTESDDAPQAPAADAALFTPPQPKPKEREPDKPRPGLWEEIDRELERVGIKASDEPPPPPAAPNLQ